MAAATASKSGCERPNPAAMRGRRSTHTALMRSQAEVQCFAQGNGHTSIAIAEFKFGGGSVRSRVQLRPDAYRAQYRGRSSAAISTRLPTDDRLVPQD